MKDSNETLNKFKHFFEIDMALKQKLVNLAPAVDLSGDIAFKYADKLYNSLSSIERQLIDIANTFDFGNDVKKAIQDSVEEYRNRIIKTDYSSADLKRIYNECFAMMSEKNLDLIRKNVFPYSMIYNDYDATIQELIDTGAEQWIIDEEILAKKEAITLDKIINQCGSVNEILHTFHDYITYDVDLLRTIQTRKQKSNDEGYMISLRGTEGEIAKQLFQKYDISMSSGDVEVISFDDNNTLLMCRDRGHALTIEIQKKNDSEVGIYYFVPKMGAGGSILDYSNIDLKGISSKKGSSFIIGSFVSNVELAVDEVMNIIKLMPTDKEMMHQLAEQSASQEKMEYSPKTQELLDAGQAILNQSVLSSDYSVDQKLESYTKLEQGITEKTNLSEEEKQDLRNALWADFDNYVEQNPEQSRTR